jgi:flagellar biosynthesis/type III secretory pathway protein FliH
MSDRVQTYAKFNMIDVEDQISQSKQQANTAADTLFAAATKKSEEIVKKAIDDRDSMFTSAREEGHKEGHEKGLEEGMKAGEENFVTQLRGVLKQQSSELIQLVEQMPEAINFGRQVLKESYEKDFLSLAYEVASLIVQKDLRDNDFNAAGILEQMVYQVMDHEKLLIEVNPEHVEALEKFLPELHLKMGSLGDTKVRGVEGFEKFKIKIKTEKGSVESSPQLSLERLKKEWNLQ